MQTYEYKAIPAPNRGQKEKGLKTTEDRFAHAITGLLNEMAADGWEFQRAESLPCEERSGLTGRSTTTQNILVFRRFIGGETTLSAEPPMTRAGSRVVTMDGPIVLSSSNTSDADDA